MKKKLSICERRDLRLIAAQDEADAIYWLKNDIDSHWDQLVEYKQWQVAELRDYKPEDLLTLIDTLKSEGVRLMHGPRLFAITVHFEVSVYVEFQPSTHDTGLAGESGVSVASDGEGAGKGSLTTH